MVPSYAPSMSPSTASNNPTAPPSLTPTTASFAPSQQVLPVVSFTSQLTLSAVSSSTLTAADETSIAQAAAASMGLTSNEVAFVTYTSSPSVDSLRRSSGGKTSSFATGSSTISAEVQTSVLVYSGQSASAVYTQLAQALSTAVDDSSVFNEYLHTYASENGATAMTTASAAAVSNGPLVETSPSSSGNKNNLKTGGELAGIIVGCVVGVALVVYVLYRFVVRPTGGLLEKTKGMASKNEDNTAL